MRRKNIAVVGMLLVTCLSSVGCGQKKDKQESLAATKTSAFETASEKQTEEKTEKETIKETSKENVKETETETEKETESKTEADTKTAVSESDELADGVYTADFNTDSSMFHVNEACAGRGTLTVKDGKITGYTCSKCKLAAVEAPNYASIPTGAQVITGNWYFPVNGTVTPDNGKDSPKTFDAGIAMYVGMALTSVAGSAVVIGKKKEF